MSKSTSLAVRHRSDDPAPFDLYLNGQFRPPSVGELKTIKDHFKCREVEVSAPFLLLEDPWMEPRAPTYAGLVVVVNKNVKEIHPFFALKSGDTKIPDPLQHLAAAPLAEIAEAVVNLKRPGLPEVKRVDFFWDTMIVHLEINEIVMSNIPWYDLPRPGTLPGRFAGRNVSYRGYMPYGKNGLVSYGEVIICPKGCTVKPGRHVVPLDDRPFGDWVCFESPNILYSFVVMSARFSVERKGPDKSLSRVTGVFPCLPMIYPRGCGGWGVASIFEETEIPGMPGQFSLSGAFGKDWNYGI